MHCIHYLFFKYFISAIVANIKNKILKNKITAFKTTNKSYIKWKLLYSKGYIVTTTVFDTFSQDVTPPILRDFLNKTFIV